MIIGSSRKHHAILPAKIVACRLRRADVDWFCSRHQENVCVFFARQVLSLHLSDMDLRLDESIVTWAQSLFDKTVAHGTSPHGYGETSSSNSNSNNGSGSTLASASASAFLRTSGTRFGQQGVFLLHWSLPQEALLIQPAAAASNQNAQGTRNATPSATALR